MSRATGLTRRPSRRRGGGRAAHNAEWSAHNAEQPAAQLAGRGRAREGRDGVVERAEGGTVEEDRGGDDGAGARFGGTRDGDAVVAAGGVLRRTLAVARTAGDGEERTWTPAERAVRGRAIF